MAQEMPIRELIETIAPGEPHGWGVEILDLLARDRRRTRALAASITAHGVRTPVLIGDDGRLWDGHHRVVASIYLGRETIPAEYAGGDR